VQKGFRISCLVYRSGGLWGDVAEAVGGGGVGPKKRGLGELCQKQRRRGFCGATMPVVRGRETH